MPDDETLRDAERLDELPTDSDVEVDDVTPARPPRPVHLRPQYLGIVLLGGTLGTGVREALSLLIPPIGAFPMAIFLINVTGAFALGVALEILLRLGPDEGHRRRLRLFVGTGFMGGYTTYSTLAIGTAFLAAARAWPSPLLDNLPANCPYPIAVGASAAANDIAIEDATIAFLSSAVQSQVSVAVRLIPLGQTAGLAVIAALEPHVTALAATAVAASLADIGSIAYATDITQMRHETLGTRIFRS